MVIPFKKAYPEIYLIAEKLSQQISNMIQIEAKYVESKMPYKSQAILEELIKLLQDQI